MADVPDFSTMSDEQVLQLAGASAPTLQPASSGMDFSAMSDSQIMQLAGIQPERTWGDTATNLGQSLGRGLGTMGGFVMDVGKAALFGPQVQREPETDQWTMENPFQNTQVGINTATNLVGAPDYSNASTAERYIGAGVEALPFGIMGGPVGYTAAFTSGIGGEAATDLGAPRWSGELLGGALPFAVKAGAMPFTRTGQREMAKSTLEQAAGKEGKQRILAATPDEMANRTFAEIAQTPSAAKVQKQIGKEVGEDSNQILKILNDRTAQGQDTLKEIAPTAFDDVTPDVRGQTIRETSEKTAEAAKKEYQRIWSNVDKELKIPVKNEQRVSEIDEIIQTFNMDDELSSGAAKNLNTAKEIYNSESVTLGRLQNLRKVVSKNARKAARAGDDPEAAALYQLRNQIDDSIASAADTGTIPEAKREAYREALRATGEYKTTYKEGAAGNILAPGSTEGYKMAGSNVTQNIYRTPENTRSFMKAYGDNPQAVAEARSGLVSEMYKKKSPDARVKFFNDKKAQFKELFRDDYNTVQKVVDEMDSQASIGRLEQEATGRGSITSQGNTVARFLSDGRAITSTLKRFGTAAGSAAGFASGAGVGGAVVGGVTGRVFEKLATMSDDAVKSMLAQAMVDPAFAKELLKQPTPKNLENAARILVSRGLVTGLTKEEESKINTDNFKVYVDGQKNTPAPAFKSNNKSGDIAGTIQQSIKEPKPTGGSKGAGKASKSVDVDTLIDSQPPLIRSMIKFESSRNPKATGPQTKYGKAKGLMQLIDSTAKELGVTDPYDPVQNIEGGKKYILQMLKKYKNTNLALAAYNWGPGNLDKLIRRKGTTAWNKIVPHLPSETRKYVSNILTDKERYNVSDA